MPTILPMGSALSLCLSDRNHRRLPPAALYTAPLPNQVSLQQWGLGSSFLPPVWRRNSHTPLPPGTPRWEALVSDYKGVSFSAAILARACHRRIMRGVRVSGPHASLSSQFGSPPAFALTLGGTGCLQKEEIHDQPVGQDVGCGQPPERNSLGPLESEASRSGKANILSFCLSSCV